jgi:sugar/nucleoside kinase (ribokinase family)
VKLHAIGFGSLNLDEFWEVPRAFLKAHHLEPGQEYVRDLDWFQRVYAILHAEGVLRARDPGGSAANMIAALRRMGFNTGFYGVTGRADAPLIRLEELGPSENLKIRMVETPAGRCLALIEKGDLHRDRALVILPNANDSAGSELPEFDYFEQAQWIHLTSFVSGGPLAVQIYLVNRLSGHTRVSFDPGAVYTARGFSALEPLLTRTDILFVTAEELVALTGEPTTDKAASKLLELAIGTVVLKMGQRGIMAFETGKSYHTAGTKPHRIVDRTGAGDVAAAGFLAGLIEGIGIEGSLEIAAAAASKSIEGYGRSAYPDRDFFNNAAGPWKKASTRRRG